MSDVAVKIDLPVENWLDIFSFVPRRALANQAAYFNRFLSSIAQLWLHEKCGKVTLKELELSYGVYNTWNEEIEFPEVPPPENIVSFEKLVIKSHCYMPNLSAPIKRMLTLMRPLFLGGNVDIRVQQPIPPNFLAFILWGENRFDSAGSILKDVFVNSISYTIKEDQHVNWIFKMDLLSGFANLRVLCFHGSVIYWTSSALEFFCEWLNNKNLHLNLMHIGCEKAQPRMLVLKVADLFAAELIWHARQEFLAAASSPVTFFVCMRICGAHVLQQMPEFHLENDKTQEVCSLVESSNNLYVLSRYERAMGEEWYREKVAELYGWESNDQEETVLKSRQIVFL